MKITVTFHPWKLEVNSDTCPSTKLTISDYDRDTRIEYHIEKHLEAWQELAIR